MLIGLEVFTVVMAIYGSVSVLVDATGFGLKEEWLRGSPFPNYQIPAVALLAVGGGSFRIISAGQTAVPSGHRRRARIGRGSRIIGIAVLVLLLLYAGFIAVFHGWYDRWDATQAEVQAALPGDSQVPHPTQCEDEGRSHDTSTDSSGRQWGWISRPMSGCTSRSPTIPGVCRG